MINRCVDCDSIMPNRCISCSGMYDQIATLTAERDALREAIRDTAIPFLAAFAGGYMGAHGLKAMAEPHARGLLKLAELVGEDRSADMARAALKQGEG